MSTTERVEKYYILVVHCQLLCYGYIVTQSPPYFPSEEFGKGRGQTELEVYLPMPRHVLIGIESRRKDDIQFSLHLGGIVSYVGSDKVTHFEKLTCYHEWYCSQKQWSDILRKLGYRDYWIAEIDRPQIEGWEVVKEHLEKAAAALESKDFEKTMSECRVAWNSLDPLMNSLIDELKAKIDEGSAGEEGHPSKSSRILSLRESVRNWSHIGIHRESYKVLPEDAILCYRETVSLVAYISRIASQITNVEE